MKARARDVIADMLKETYRSSFPRSLCLRRAAAILSALDAAGLEVREKTDGRREWMLKAAVWHENAAFQCNPESAAFHNDCAGTLRLVHDMEQRRAMIAKGQA